MRRCAGTCPVVFSAHDFEAALKRKGFRHERNTTDRLFYLWVDDKRTSVWTKVSQGRSEDIGDGMLLTRIKQQMHLSKTELHDFVRCPLSYDAYLQRLRERQVIAVRCEHEPVMNA